MEDNINKFNDIGSAFLISRNRQNAASSMHLEHYHDAYELYYLLEGERNYFIKDRIYSIQKGDLVFININDLHRTIQSGPESHERILINFKHDFISSMFPSNQVIKLLAAFQHRFCAIRLDIVRQEYVENLLYKMLSEEKKKGYGYEISIRIMLIELLLFINRFIRQNPYDAFEVQDPLQNKISDVVNYINSNYMETLTLTQLSKVFLISPYYLSRVFKQVTGFNFIEYVNHVRIKESKRLLRESSASLTQIAGNTGFDSSTHFGRVFKIITGMSPLKYRKANN